MDGQYARGLRRFAKRRLAISSAIPVAVAIVAAADAFIYSNGMPCYTDESSFMRLLNLHSSSPRETSIRIRPLVNMVFPFTRFCVSWKYEWDPIHYADGLSPCLYRQYAPVPSTWLVVLEPATQRVVTIRPLPQDSKFFVRNNAEDLVCGYRMDRRMDRGVYVPWVLRQFRVRDRTWEVMSSVREPLVGYSANLSASKSLTTLYVVKVNTINDWLSHYFAAEFRLTQSGMGENASRQSSWQRRHHDRVMPMLNARNALHLVQDPVSRAVMVLDVRMERLGRPYLSIRTCYREVLTFPDHPPSSHGPQPILAHRDGDSSTYDGLVPVYQLPHPCFSEGLQYLSWLCRSRLGYGSHIADPAAQFHLASFCTPPAVTF